MQKGYPGLYLQAPVPRILLVPGKSNSGRNAFPPAGPRNRPVGRYSTKNYL